MRNTATFEIIIIVNPFLHMRKLGLEVLNNLPRIIELLCEVVGYQVNTST